VTNAMSEIMHDGGPFDLGRVRMPTQVGDAKASFEQALAAQGGRDKSEARESAEQLIGMALFMPLLKQIQDSPLRNELMHGGRGEEVFAERLNQTLADRLGQRMGGGLVDAVVERFEQTQSKVDTRG